AYQTAYMKANYPAEYICAVLTAESGDVDKIAEIIHESRRMNIPVLPPDVNESRGNFAVIKGRDEQDPKSSLMNGQDPPSQKAMAGQDLPSLETSARRDKIRFGLYTIKNFGYDIGDGIIEEREKNGRYKSFSDFLERVHHKNLTKKSLEALIKTGAMDELGERGQMLFNMESALGYNKHVIEMQASDQSSLFGGLDNVSIPGFQLKESKEASMDEKLMWEKELLGLYISGHPLDKFRDKIKAKNATIRQLQEKVREGVTCLVAGTIDDVKEILTKKGDKMAFVRIADHEDTLEVVVFPRIFTEFKEILIPGTCVVIKGKVSKRNDELSIIVDSMKKLN
ncbi:MAG: DNA polymerase III subunit alpha, partial [Candidatus Pacebacteria bacterium]|nr:DNA polymerase III subunit alpha [Candidatus Paceibacterota bacterium]